MGTTGKQGDLAREGELQGRKAEELGNNVGEEIEEEEKTRDVMEEMKDDKELGEGRMGGKSREGRDKREGKKIPECGRRKKIKNMNEWRCMKTEGKKQINRENGEEKKREWRRGGGEEWEIGESGKKLEQRKKSVKYNRKRKKR